MKCYLCGCEIEDGYSAVGDVNDRVKHLGTVGCRDALQEALKASQRRVAQLEGLVDITEQLVNGLIVWANRKDELINWTPAMWDALDKAHLQVVGIRLQEALLTSPTPQPPAPVVGMEESNG